MGRSAKIRHRRRRRAERSGALAERLFLKRRRDEENALRGAMAFDTARAKREVEKQILARRVAKLPPIVRWRKPIPSSV